MFCTFEELLLWGYSAFRGAGSRCFLQVFKMVILFNSVCLVHQIAYTKHFCFHKKYVQLCWKTWSSSFSGLPKGKCFLFLQEIFFLIKAWQCVIPHQNFLWEKFLLINSSPNPGKGLLVLQLLLVGAAWAEMWARGGHWAMVMFSFGKQRFVLARWEGTGFLGLSLQWHLAVE